MNRTDIQYVSNEKGETVAVIVPIEMWHDLESEKETAYLLKSPQMKSRLLEAKNRQDGMTLEEVCENLRI